MSVTEKELIEFSCILPRLSDERYSFSRKHPTRYISRIVFRDYSTVDRIRFLDQSNEIAPDTYAELSEEDTYKQLILPGVQKAKEHPVYSKIFNPTHGEVLKKSVTAYLKQFKIFKDCDFDKEDRHPYPEYHVIDTYCSLAYLFAEYLSDLKRYQLSKLGRHKDDYLRHLKNVRDSCITIIESLGIDAALDLELVEAKNINSIYYLKYETEFKIREIELIGKNGKQLPERLLSIRLGYNLMSIMTGGYEPLLDTFWSFGDPHGTEMTSKSDRHFSNPEQNHFQAPPHTRRLAQEDIKATYITMHNWCADFCAMQDRDLNIAMPQNVLQDRLVPLFSG